jgi:hypothetical protein
MYKCVTTQADSSLTDLYSGSWSPSRVDLCCLKVSVLVLVEWGHQTKRKHFNTCIYLYLCLCIYILLFKHSCVILLPSLLLRYQFMTTKCDLWNSSYMFFQSHSSTLQGSAASCDTKWLPEKSYSERTKCVLLTSFLHFLFEVSKHAPRIKWSIDSRRFLKARSQLGI